LTSLMMSSCCTLRLKRRSAFSRDSPSCSRTSAKLTHPQTRPVGPNSYYKVLTLSQGEEVEISGQSPGLTLFRRKTGFILRRWPTRSLERSEQHRQLAPLNSEVELESQLNLPRRQSRTENRSVGAVPENHIGISKLRVIEHVEGLHTKLHAHALAEFCHGELFE
jgi:hypothetical protein